MRSLDFSECKRLDLQYNTISEVELGAFNGLTALTRLDLSNNQIHELKSPTFNLSDNHISSIQDNTFVNLRRLEILSLDHNRLESLSPGTFCGLESIKELQLDNNYLTSLPQDVFIHLPRPLTIYLYGNQLQCNDALCWLRQEELNGTITLNRDGNRYIGNPVCVNGVNWDTWSCSQTGDVSLLMFCHI